MRKRFDGSPARLWSTGLAVLVAGGVVARPAQAALGAVGPVDPSDGFPLWYSDGAGLTLTKCLANSPLCFLSPIPNTALPVSFPDNYPEEMFYWSATADAPPATPGFTALLVLALEGAFFNTVTDGDQMVFARIRVRITGLVPGATYTVTHPYGVDTFVADAAARNINSTVDVGTVPIGLLPAAFSLALAGRLGPLLTWAPFSSAPAGYVGDGATPHVVTGSPLGTNFFRVEGPGIGSAGCVPAAPDCVQTDLFTVMGQLFAGHVTSVSATALNLANIGSPLVVSGTVPSDATLVTSTLGALVQTAVPAAVAWTLSFPAADLATLADGPLVLDTSMTLPLGAVPIDTRTINKDTVAPGPVTGLAAAAGPGTATLTWTNPADGASARVLRSTASFATGPNDTAGQTVVFDAAGGAFADTGLVGATTWFYSVFSFDAAGNPSAAATVQATPLAAGPPPALPTAFSDNFDACVLASGLGSRWTVSGAWSCTGGFARGTSTDGLATAATAPMADSEAEARVQLTGTASGSGVVVRAGAGGHYAARILAAGTLEIVRKDAAGVAVLGAAANGAIRPLSFVRLTLRATGSAAVQLTASINGVPALAVTDTSASRLASGGGGMLSGAAARTQYDNFFLRAAATAAPPAPPPPGTPPPAPPPAGGLVFSDNFDACTSTTSLGPNWTISGRFYCAAARARGEAANGIATANTAALGNTTVEALVQLAQAGANGTGVVARAAGGSYYAARLLAAGRLQLIRVDAGTTTVLADVPATVVVGSSRRLRLTVSGTAPVQLTVVHDGKPAATASDGAAGRLLTGAAGILSGTVARSQYDNFTVRSP